MDTFLTLYKNQTPFIFIRMTMTKTEIAATVDSLNDEERSYLSVYLKMKQLMSDEIFKQEVSKRYKTMKAGQAVPSEQVKDLHNRLTQNGL